MENVANGKLGAAGGKKSLKQRAFGELEKYAVITVYLWLLLALFSLQKQLIQGHGISLWHQGFAIFNALIFGKVILIGEVLEVGRGLERRALIWAVLGKSLIFAVLLLAFHVVEEMIRVWLGSEPLSMAFVGFAGTLPGFITEVAIFFVVLIPFFAFQEVARILGNGVLWSLVFHSDKKRFRLIEDSSSPVQKAGQ